MCSQQGVGERGNKSIRPVCLSTTLGVNYWGGDCKWPIHLCEWSVNKSKLETGITDSILGVPKGFAWLQQSPHVSLGKISRGTWSGFKAQAFTSIPPSFHPSIAPAWSSTATYPYLKLQKPLLWVAYHPCNDKVQMWIHPHSSESHWNPLWKVLVATATTVNLQSIQCLKKTD